MCIPVVGPVPSSLLFVTLGTVGLERWSQTPFLSLSPSARWRWFFRSHEFLSQPARSSQPTRNNSIERWDMDDQQVITDDSDLVHTSTYLCRVLFNRHLIHAAPASARRHSRKQALIACFKLWYLGVFISNTLYQRDAEWIAIKQILRGYVIDNNGTLSSGLRLLCSRNFSNTEDTFRPQNIGKGHFGVALKQCHEARI